MNINQARAIEPTYQARESVQRALDQTTLIAVVGGIAVGKNFLMQHSPIAITGTETTRSPRADDDERLYTYSTKEHMLDAIESRELVQYGVAPSGDIYGSRLKDYALDAPNLSDIWASYVSTLDNKGYGRIAAVSVLTPPEQWMSQLAVRGDGMTAGQMDSRLDEARYSIKWSIAKHLTQAANHLIIINTPRTVDDNLEQISVLAHGEEPKRLDDDKVLNAAHAMNKVIDIMYTRLKG